VAAPGDPAEPVRPVDELVRGTPQRPAEEPNPEELGERRAARDEGAANAAARRDEGPKSDTLPAAVHRREERQEHQHPGDEAPDEQQQQELQELKQRDAEVRRHESAHRSAGAGVVRGGATFRYQRGPDGRLYAVGGEVSVDATEGRTPEETIRKARQIRRAALAPAEPSAHDRSIAARAAAMEAQARLALVLQQVRQEAAPAADDEGEEPDGEDPKAARAARAYGSPPYEAPNLKIKI